jgi:hypothetical protein
MTAFSACPAAHSAGRSHDAAPSGCQPSHRCPETGQPAHRQRTRPVEHAFADLKNWHILTKLRTDAAHATMLLRALLVLTHSEISR